MSLTIYAYDQLSPEFDKVYETNLLEIRWEYAVTLDLPFPVGPPMITYAYENRYSFKAGKFEAFRDWLEAHRFVGEDFKLLHFIDNGGKYLSWRQCAVLAENFQRHFNMVCMYSPNEYFKRKYIKWMTATTIAAEGGAIVFDY